MRIPLNSIKRVNIYSSQDSPKIKEEETILNSINKNNIVLTQKPDNHSTEKEKNYRTNITVDVMIDVKSAKFYKVN